ncbi:MAG: hypothetical protein L0Z50_23750 [Verrucomicrobiales bacterium]|nr:hypothetical protein [Verrucomicrobiales bacterium]
MNPGNGRASVQVHDLELEDYHDLVNALLDGPSVAAVASFEIGSTKSKDKHHFHDPGTSFDVNVAFNTATVAWEAESEFATFVSDPASTSTSLFAEVGHERNGVFF